ncbi:hypothetical protein [Bremerella cremea]|uniref:hypothetical protein n=1 Tax=Bremerella cremea TaxID=1031537 RepID=UPI0031ED526F
MKKLLSVVATLMLLANVGCTMCSHPFDYEYAAFDEAQLSGQRAGSAFAPYSSQSVVTEVGPTEAAIEEEVMYYETTN